MKKLALQGIIKCLSGVVLLGALLFWPAGTWDYPGAWRMIAILFIPMVIFGTVLFLKAPELLKKRLNSSEAEKDQKIVILLSSIMFIACFLLCAFDFKYGWTKVPNAIVFVGCIVFLLTYVGFAELMRENAYLSRTVEVQENQQVISTGLYGIVRHPMYFIVTFMFLSMPIVIGSWVGVLPLIGLPVILVKRIRNEEKVLEEGLAGYKEYEKKVKYHMIPFIW